MREANERWANSLEFFLSCIALSVGLGNVWRFPAVALDNGGGAFLIPYLCVLTFVGRPMYYLELCIGQFSSSGNVKVWNMCPAMKGIGYGQMLCTACVVSYYVAIKGITLFYFFSTFASELPWSLCPSNITSCIDRTVNSSSRNSTTAITAAEIFFNDKVVKTYKNGLDDGIFSPDLYLTMYLLLSWVVIFIVLCKGVQSSGKAAYFMALFPYVVLFILLIRGLTLPGAFIGIKYFFMPQWDKLLEPEVWKKAVGQCFFSLSVGFGPVVIMSSFNDFRHNVYRDALIISLIDTLTSILAGSITFAIMGYLAQELGTDDIQKVIKDGGLSLAFISYADVLSRFPWCPQFFAALFFMMLFTLGAGSATGLWNVVITIICDNFPHYNRSKVTLITCIIGFLSGLIYMTPQGQYVTKIIDAYATDTGAYVLAIIEVLTIQYIYGFHRLLKDIKFMLGRETGFYWKLCWIFLTPISLISILVYSFFNTKPLKMGDYEFGPIAKGFSIGMTVLIVAMVPLFFFVQMYKKYFSSAKQSLIVSFLEPSSKWGPSDPDLRLEYQTYIAEDLTTNNAPNEISSPVTALSIFTISNKDL